MKTTLDYKKLSLRPDGIRGFRCAASRRSAREWHPVHAAEEAEVRTLVDARLPKSIQAKEFT